MAIVRTDPERWEDVNVVQLDSDAPDNDKAILDIESWAADKGFARTNEYWLRPIWLGNGRRVLRGICYRLTREEIGSAETACRNSAEAVADLPVTPHQTESD
jgi:hypothetical protein